jgi:hypothetical protein
MSIELLAADGLEREMLAEFWNRCYGPRKSEFLSSHSEWWYRGSKNSLAIVSQGQIAAYCALIPVKCAISGRATKACWWLDLIVAPEFRGKGLQKLIDKELRDNHELLLGFPNDIAAKIHRKHSWGVRENGATMMLPIRPHKIPCTLSSGGIAFKLFSLSMVFLSPATPLITRRIDRFNPQQAGIHKPDAWDSAKIENIFLNNIEKQMVTTWRGRDFLEWRFLDSPFAKEYDFFVAGSRQRPTHYLVARTFRKGGGIVTRILDVFGDFSKTETVKDLVKAAVKNSARKGSCQVTAMAWDPQIISILNASGFLIRTKARFCWFSQSKELFNAIERANLHWTLSDSDNDETT